MEKSVQIEILRRELKCALETFDFDRAEELTTQIDNLQIDVQKDREFQTFGNRTLTLDEQREVLLNERTHQERELMSARTKIQRRFHDRYRVLQEKHTAELQKLASDQAIALEREAMRTIPEVTQLELEAKIKGKERKYAEAKKIYNEAVETRNRIVEARKESVNAYYEKQRGKLIERQENELRILKEKQNTEMADVDHKYTAQDEMIEKHIKVKELRAQKEVTQRSVMMRTVSPILQKKRDQMAKRGGNSSARYSPSRI